MLAASYKEGDDLPFPLLATPKIDGIRALIVKGRLVSRSFRPLPNVAVRSALESVLPEGADGEITCGDLYATTSVVMSESAGADSFQFSWFDWAYDLDAPYEHRVRAIEEYLNTHSTDRIPGITIVPLVPVSVNDYAELEEFDKTAIEQGYEGVVVRVPHGKYKCGRSTMKEGLMIKIKRFVDEEAEIIATEELMYNTNEQHSDNFGNAKKSSFKEGMVRGDTLGAIIAMTPDCKIFKIGTGFTMDERNALWANRDTIAGMLVKYKCADGGSKDMPRCPVFIGIRHKDDTN